MNAQGVAACGAVILSLAACGGGNDEADSEPTTTLAVAAATTTTEAPTTTAPTTTEAPTKTTARPTTTTARPTTTERDVLSRDTQLAVLDCSDELGDAVLGVLIPSGDDGSTPACEEAERLLFLDGDDGLAGDISTLLEECRRYYGQFVLAVVDDQDAEAAINNVYDCAEELRQSVRN